MKTFTVSKVFLSILAISIFIFSCKKESSSPEPPMFFPDPDFDNTYYDAMITGIWEVDSVIDLTWDPVSDERTRNTTTYNITGSENYRIIYKEDNSYNKIKNGQSSTGEYVYDHSSLRVEEFYDHQRAALVNVSESELVFCYNSNSGNGPEARRLYYLRRIQ